MSLAVSNVAPAELYEALYKGCMTKKEFFFSAARRRVMVRHVGTCAVVGGQSMFEY
jgi:hypothetical protein